MNIEKPSKITVTLEETPLDDVQRRDDVQFQTEVQQLIRDAEQMRLSYMRKTQRRTFMTAILNILFVLAGSLLFAWLFLLKGSLFTGAAVLLLSFIPSLILTLWTGQPAKHYQRAYKAEFLPKMAKALGGLKFFPSRGIGAKVIRKTGVLPSFTTYQAEDCFMGRYNGVKVLFSEAKLFNGKNKLPVFNGVFALLEVPESVFEGHTIITADIDMANQRADKQWRKLQNVSLNIKDPVSNRFKVFSSTPEAASLMVGERLLKELGEVADVFKKSLLSAVLFQGKYIFLAIPHDEDMFEASDVRVPVATQQHALHCKREIDKLLEVIDVFDLYNAKPVTVTPPNS